MTTKFGYYDVSTRAGLGPPAVSTMEYMDPTVWNDERVQKDTVADDWICSLRPQKSLWELVATRLGQG